jgi:hypothetical protein
MMLVSCYFERNACISAGLSVAMVLFAVKSDTVLAQRWCNVSSLSCVQDVRTFIIMRTN